MEDKELNEMANAFYAKVRSITKFDLGLIIAYVLFGVIAVITSNYTGIAFSWDEFLYGFVMVALISYWIWRTNISATAHGLMDFWDFLDKEGYNIVKKEEDDKNIDNE